MQNTFHSSPRISRSEQKKITGGGFAPGGGYAPWWGCSTINTRCFANQANCVNACAGGSCTTYYDANFCYCAVVSPPCNYIPAN
jgi:hypothetical protein